MIRLTIILIAIGACAYGQDVEFMEGPPEVTPKYPYAEEVVIQIKKALEAVPEFTFMQLYFGNNKTYVPCITVNLNLKSVKKVDSTYIQSIQKKIFSCFPPGYVHITTLMCFKGKPFSIVSGSQEYSQIIYHYVDSIKSRVKELLPDIKRLQLNSEIRTHQIEKGYVSLKISQFTTISYLEVWVQSSDVNGQIYLSKYKPGYKNPWYESKSELTKAIPLTRQKYGFSADVEELIKPPNTTINRYLYYSTNSGDLIEKSLYYVDENTERYTEYFLRIF